MDASIERRAHQDRRERRALGAEYLRYLAQPVLHAVVAIWIFSGALLLIEPSPYEVMFLAVLPAAIVARVGLHRGTLNLFILLALFTPFALISSFQVTYNTIPQALTYVGVTIFLLFTSYFVANYVADAPYDRMRIIMRAYTLAAVLSSLIGIFAYLGLLPGADLFLLYGRAKAAFQDPNVYGPFLMLPAMYALQRMLLHKSKRALWGGALFGLLFTGIFVSFSRAAWGYVLFSSMMVFSFCYLLEANVQQKVRMLILALGGIVLSGVMLAGLLSIPSVNALFMERASLSQSYDTGENGRFGRQGYAFDLALQHPWGLGPLEFRNLRIIEEPHDTYVNVLHAYGWGGGLIYWVLVGITLWRCVLTLGTPSPNRLIMIPLVATYVPLVLESAIIDTDHWRHYFLLVGLIWGVSAGYKRLSPAQMQGEKTLI